MLIIQPKYWPLRGYFSVSESIRAYSQPINTSSPKSKWTHPKAFCEVHGAYGISVRQPGIEPSHWGRRSRTTPRLPRHREMRAFVSCITGRFFTVEPPGKSIKSSYCVPQIYAIFVCQLHLSKAEKGKYNTTISCRTSPQLYQLLPFAPSILLLSLSTDIYTHTHTHTHTYTCTSAHRYFITACIVSSDQFENTLQLSFLCIS